MDRLLSDVNLIYIFFGTLGNYIMAQYNSRTLLIFSTLSLLVHQSHAAEALSLQNLPFSQIKQMFQPQSSGLLKTNAPAANALNLVSEHKDSNNVMHIRMQQHYLGYPVLGGYAIFHGQQSAAALWRSSNQSTTMNGTVYQGLQRDLGQPTANFVTRGGEALAHFKSKYAKHSLSGENVTPMVFVDADKRAHWAYKVSVVISDGERIPERPMAIIDAQTYQVYLSWNDIKTLNSKVAGKGFSGNAHSGRLRYGVELPLLSLMRDDKAGICYMENEHTKVVDMQHRQNMQNKPMSFSCKEERRREDGTFLTGYLSDGYDKINGAYSPSNDALYSGHVIYDMYTQWYGVNPLEEKGKAKLLVMRVHFGQRYENAYWDGQQMTFGDGGKDFYPLVSLGIAAHEISHGFTEQHSDLIYTGQSGGINESFSDMAAQLAEYYTSGKNSWMIGADIVKAASGMEAFRFMDKPSKDGYSIDNASQFTPDMDVHFSSGVFNRLFYLLSTQPGWDVRRAFDVMLSANADYWTPTSTFDEAACGILQAAKGLNYSLESVQSALDQVDVHYADCDVH
jgi:pseudolysin